MLQHIAIMLQWKNADMTPWSATIQEFAICFSDKVCWWIKYNVRICRIFWCYVSVCQQLLLQGVCSIDANINSGNYYIDLLWLSVIFDVIFGRHTVNTVLISGGEIWLPYYSNTVIYWFWFLRIKISTRQYYRLDLLCSKTRVTFTAPATPISRITD